MNSNESGAQSAVIAPWLKDIRGTQVLPIIESDSKIIRVEAGPGTGKTFGVVRRVQRLLHPDGLNLPGKDVLVVAFNRVIAKDLKKEINKGLASSPHDGEPIIQTVHAMCLMVVGGHLRILLPHEIEAMIYDVFTAYPKIKEKYKTRKKAEQGLRNHEAGNVNDPELWQAVVLWLKRHQARLISELPKLLSDRLKGGDFGDRQYKHVIVDEYQDLTDVLQKLFLQLRSPDGHFMALGDPRQSIYAFLGNDPEGLAKISALAASSGETVEDITMTECQRCPVEIVTASNHLMSLSSALPMVPGNAETADIYGIVWNTVEKESIGMAKAILDNIKRYPKDKHLAMVTRRKFGYMLRDKLLKLESSLKVDLSFSESLLESWSVREAFLLFCLLVDPDPATWRSWLSYANSVDGSNAKATAANRNSDAYLKVLKANEDKIDQTVIGQMANATKAPSGNGGRKIWERAKRFLELREKFCPDPTDLSTLLTSTFDLSNWPIPPAEEGETTQTDMNLAATKTQQILDDVTEKHPNLEISDRLKKVVQILRYQIATKEPFVPEEDADLQITTLWGAKGVTADHVYVLGLCKEALPGSRRDDYPGTETEYFEEQRRLFYVSITRSKKTMVLSRPAKIRFTDAERIVLEVKPGWGHWADLEMCDFLRDIMGFLPTFELGENWKGMN